MAATRDAKSAARPAAATGVAAEVARRIAEVVKVDPRRVFSPSDFADLGTPYSAGMALTRLVRAGKIRRIARGLYDVPREDPMLGVLLPAADAVVAAVVRRDKIRVQPTGVQAANELHLSEQVPARMFLLTDGPSRVLRYGAMEIHFVHTSPRNMAGAGRLSGLVIHAFKAIGKPNLTPARIARLHWLLPEEERTRLLDDLALAPAWMRPLIQSLAPQSPVRAGRPRPSSSKRRARR